MISSKALLEQTGEFIQVSEHLFFIITDEGNFIWQDPDNGGNHSLRPYKGSYSQFLKEYNVKKGDVLGKRRVREIVGDGVMLII